MLAFIAAPLVVLAVLVYAMTIAMERGPSMVAEPVGAGAGRTGGANALGEALFGRDASGSGIPAERAARGVVLVVHDESGMASEARPLLLVTSWTGWTEPQAMRPRGDGAWEVRLASAPDDRPLAFRFELGPGRAPEVDAAGEPMGERRLPRVSREAAEGPEPLVYEFRVRDFLD